MSDFQLKLVNFILFYIGWTLCILFHSFWAGIAGLVLAAINLTIERSCFPICIAAGCVALLGVTNDILVFHFEVLQFTDQPQQVMSLWILALWFLFSTTYHSSLAWMKQLRLWMQALAGGFFGALSYVVGSRFGGVEYIYDGLPQFAFHFINWVWLYPLSLRLHTWILHRLQKK